MSTMHNTTKPRYSMWAPSTEESPGGRVCPTEPTHNEAMFWLAVGYTVEVSQWNGQCFATSDVLKPDQ